MQNSLFDLANRYASLSEAGDPLERLNAVIDWEIFRPVLERIDSKERKSTAGRNMIRRIQITPLVLALGLLSGSAHAALQGRDFNGSLAVLRLITTPTSTSPGWPMLISTASAPPTGTRPTRTMTSTR